MEKENWTFAILLLLLFYCHEWLNRMEYVYISFFSRCHSNAIRNGVFHSFYSLFFIAAWKDKKKYCTYGMARCCVWIIKPYAASSVTQVPLDLFAICPENTMNTEYFSYYTMYTYKLKIFKWLSISNNLLKRESSFWCYCYCWLLPLPLFALYIENSDESYKNCHARCYILPTSILCKFFPLSDFNSMSPSEA